MRQDKYGKVSIRRIIRLRRIMHLFYASERRLIRRGSYTAARRYEFYIRAVKTIFYERAQRVSKILFLPREIKFISSSHCVIFFLLYGQEHSCTNSSVKAGNDVIDILTSEDMEKTPLEPRMQFRMNFTRRVVYFSTKTLLPL